MSPVDEYANFKPNTNTFLNEKRHKHHKKLKKSKKSGKDLSENVKSEIKKSLKKSDKNNDGDVKEHGGWRKVTKVSHISGALAVKLCGGYIKCLDDGSFTTGLTLMSGQVPEPEQIYLGVRIGTNASTTNVSLLQQASSTEVAVDDATVDVNEKVAFKTGYGKYMSLDLITSEVRAISEAIGPLEQWQPVFEDGRLALLGSNGKFLSVRKSDDVIVCDKDKVTTDEIVDIRTNGERAEDRVDKLAVEDRGSLGQIELNYVKKFQKFQNHKTKLCDDNRMDLLNARKEGKLHMQMLDRREKMKADRYCK